MVNVNTVVQKLLLVSAVYELKVSLSALPAILTLAGTLVLVAVVM
jgi:hypothetical protein